MIFISTSAWVSFLFIDIMMKEKLQEADPVAKKKHQLSRIFYDLYSDASPTVLALKYDTCTNLISEVMDAMTLSWIDYDEIPVLAKLYAASNQTDLAESEAAILNLGPDRLPGILADKYNIKPATVSSIMFDLMIYHEIKSIRCD